MCTRLFLGLFAVLLLAGPASAAEEKAKPPASEGKKGSEHKLTEAESYLALDPIYTTIVADRRSAGMLMVALGLDVPAPELREQAERALPVLRDADIRSLMAFTATQVRPTAQPDPAAIADRLQSLTDRALGKKGARILLAQVALRVTN